ncbi:MAG TPA: hypothetical protein VIK62_02195 [Verrucomicrobiae bacterium]
MANHSQINFGRKKTQKPQKETMADRKTKTTLFSSISVMSLLRLFAAKTFSPSVLNPCLSVANHSQINFGRKKTQKPQKETMADRKTKTTLFSSHRLCAFCAFLRPKPFPHLCLIRVSSVAKKTWRPWRLGG